MTAVQPGLCGACLHARIIETRSGSRFYLCELSTSDSRYLRYPRLPVLACVGFRPARREETEVTRGENET